MEITLGMMKNYTLRLLKDFDVELTNELKAEVKACKTRIELERIRDKAVKQRLAKEV